MNHTAVLAKEFGLSDSQAGRVAALIEEGNTIPFIARYRKEATGGLDDQVLRMFGERLAYLRGLDKRREAIERSMEEQGVLTDALGGLPQGCTCVFLALAYAGALGLRKAFGEGSPARGVALTGLAAAAQQVWMRMWVAGTGVPVFSLEMLRLAAVAAGAGLAAGAVAFAAVGALERFVGIGGGVKFSK